jgi:hypothetical protein
MAVLYYYLVTSSGAFYAFKLSEMKLVQKMQKLLVGLVALVSTDTI